MATHGLTAIRSPSLLVVLKEVQLEKLEELAESQRMASVM